MQLQIPITKAGKGVTLTVDSDVFASLSPEQQAGIIAKGLEHFLNSRMSKLPAPSKLEGEELSEAKATALAKAEENLADLKAGKIGGIKSAKAKAVADRKVVTEARRLAREIVKNEIRKAGEKPSHFKASQITEYADAVIENDPSILEQAKANLAERASAAPKFDLSKLLKPDATLVAKARAEQAERKTQLSAKQASKPIPHKGSGKFVPPAKPMTAAQAENARTH